jgi:DNA polymerase III alpha subunit
LLAKNEAGYRNLIKLSSLSYTDGFYYKPRIDRDILRAHSEGLVATTCCLQGEVLQTILHKGEEAALPIFKEYLDIFGEDYYIEIQDHGIPEQRTCNAVLLRWADQFGVKVVATNDVHYVEQDDDAPRQTFGRHILDEVVDARHFGGVSGRRGVRGVAARNEKEGSEEEQCERKASGHSLGQK